MTTGTRTNESVHDLTPDPRPGRVVVGVDGSAPSVLALEWALAEAARRHTECRVVSASEGWALAAGDSTTDVDLVDREGAVAKLVEVARRRAGAAHVTANVVVVPGRPALVLPLATKGAALLVVGTRGRAAALEALFGSVAEECLRRSSSPVVVIPPDARIAATYQRLVVGVDGSAPSRAALAWAADEARRRDAELVLLHTWSVAVAAANPYAAVDSGVFRDAGAAILTEAVSEIQGVVPSLRSRLILGSPAHSLCEAAAGADLVVVGGRGRGLLAGALIGSISQVCARHAPCPVVVVRENSEP